MRNINSRLIRAIIIISTSCLVCFSLHVSTIYAISNDGSNSSMIVKDSNFSNSIPSGLHLTPSNNTNSNNKAPSEASSVLKSSKANDGSTSISSTHSNSKPNHLHDGADNAGENSNSNSNSKSNHHSDKNHFHSLGRNIVSKIKHKLKVGDIPFP